MLFLICIYPKIDMISDAPIQYILQNAIKHKGNIVLIAIFKIFFKKYHYSNISF